MNAMDRAREFAKELRKKSSGVSQFEEITITLKGRDAEGRLKTFKTKYKIEPYSLTLNGSRPIKQEGKRFIPSEFVFHNINFITNSKA